MKKLILLIFVCSLNLTLQAQQFISINPDFGLKGQTVITTVTGSGFFFTTGSAPSTSGDFYMLHDNFVIYPSIVSVADDDHLLVSWFIPAAAPSGGYHVIWDSMRVPGGFNVECVAPPAQITNPPTSVICPGTSIVLQANTGAGYTYQWYNSGPINGATSSSLTVTVNFYDYYHVKVTNATGCPRFSEAIVLSPFNLPIATITTSTGNPGFCAGSTVNLNTQYSAGNTYKWYKYGNLIAGATSSTYQASTAGKYKVVVTNSLGCSKASAPLNISLYPIPPSTISATGPTTFCQGSQVKLQANYGSTYTYQWYKYGNAIPGETNRNLFAGSTGPYKVEVTSAYGCSKKSTSTNVTVLATPVVTITPDGPTTFCAGGSVLLKGPNGTGNTYQWKLMGNDIPGATNKNYTATAAGNYKVAVTNSLGCTDISDPVIVTVPCRMKNEMLTENLELFPNPANTYITISGGIPLSFEVINATGQILISQEKNTANVIDISSIPAGLYLIRVVTEYGPSTLKFIKEE
ncbi:MAG: T9SS type A sorting domain-containing protein [Bacteroidetes bacterium]|nr:T9SS type A sorting domain-containing protein [Bacteroidota bacterium]